MKKFLGLLVFLGLVLTLGACSSFKDVKNNLEEAGYTVVDSKDVEGFDQLATVLDGEENEEIKNIFVVYNSSALEVALLIEYTNSEALLNDIEDLDKFTAFTYENMLLWPFGVGSTDDLVKAFKGE